jgi:WD40 repeat protein
VQLWSLATGKRERTLEDQATTIDAVAFGPGATVFGGTENGQVVVWGLSSGMPRDPVVLPGGGVVGALAVSPDGKWLAVAVQATVELFPLVGDHIGTRESVALHDPQGGMLRALAWSADSTRIITGGSGGARIWELTRRALLGRRDAGAINALALENDTLWIGGDDGTVEAWDVRVETRGVSELEKFAGKYDPWELGKDDIPVRKGDTQ